MEKALQLEEKGFFIGDSAFNLTPFLLVPYSTEEVRADQNGGHCIQGVLVLQTFINLPDFLENLVTGLLSTSHLSW